MLTARAQVAAKLETTEGTAEDLAAADCILAEKPSFRPMTPIIERMPASSSLSPYSSLQGARHAVIEFDVELKGSGVRGTPPEFASLLKACGMGETITVGESVVYVPASSSIPSVSVAVIEDGVQKKIWGARGTFNLSCLTDNICRFHFVFTGADFSIADADFLVDVSLLSNNPQPFINASFSLQSYAALIKSLRIDMANTVALRGDANSSSGFKSAVITNRKPKLTFDPEMVLVATHDFYGILRAGTEGALTAAIGSTVGNISTITANKVQYQEIGEEERDGIRTLGINCQLNRDAGDDEVRLAFT